MKKIIPLLLFILIPFINTLAQDEPTLRMDRTFNTTPGLRLDYNGISGDLFINTWEKNEARIMVYANTEATESIEINLVDGNGGINIKESSKYNSAGKHNVILRYEITLPWNYNVYISSSSSDYKVENLTGAVKVKTASGDGELNSITGPVNIVSSSGDLIMETINGEVKVNSASGDILAITINGKSDIRTASGDISLNGITDQAKVISTSGDVVYVTGNSTPGATITTTSGDISIILSDATQATVSFKTKEKQVKYEEYANGKENYNGGGNLIECKTTSGEVSVMVGNDY